MFWGYFGMCVGFAISVAMKSFYNEHFLHPIERWIYLRLPDGLLRRVLFLEIRDRYWHRAVGIALEDRPRFAGASQATSRDAWRYIRLDR